MQIPLQEFSHSAKIKYNEDCGPIVATFVNSPSFVSLNKNNIELNFEGVEPGNYSAFLQVRLRNFPSRQIT